MSRLVRLGLIQLGLPWVWFGFSTTVTVKLVVVVVVVMGVAVFATMIACMRAASVRGLPRLFATSVLIASTVAAAAEETDVVIETKG